MSDIVKFNAQILETQSKNQEETSDVAKQYDIAAVDLDTLPPAMVEYLKTKTRHYERDRNNFLMYPDMNYFEVLELILKDGLPWWEEPRLSQIFVSPGHATLPTDTIKPSELLRLDLGLTEPDEQKAALIDAIQYLGTRIRSEMLRHVSQISNLRGWAPPNSNSGYDLFVVSPEPKIAYLEREYTIEQVHELLAENVTVQGKRAQPNIKMESQRIGHETDARITVTGRPVFDYRTLSTVQAIPRVVGAVGGHDIYSYRTRAISSTGLRSTAPLKWLSDVFHDVVPHVPWMSQLWHHTGSVDLKRKLLDKYIFASDFSNYDGTIPEWAFEEVFSIFGPNVRTLANPVTRNTTVAFIVGDDQVPRYFRLSDVAKGNPSGIPLTDIVAKVVAVAVSLAILTTLSGIDADYDTALKRITNMGDDNVVAFDRPDDLMTFRAAQEAFEILKHDEEKPAKFIGYLLKTDQFSRVQDVILDPVSLVINTVWQEHPAGHIFRPYAAYGLMQRIKVYQEEGGGKYIPFLSTLRNYLIDIAIREEARAQNSTESEIQKFLIRHGLRKFEELFYRVDPATVIAEIGEFLTTYQIPVDYLRDFLQDEETPQKGSPLNPAYNAAVAEETEEEDSA